MIHEVSGDILLSSADGIAHGVAPNDHFDSGLALSLRKDWPALYKDFRHYCHSTAPGAGSAWVWTSADGRRFVNLFTQDEAPSEHARPGKASISNVNHCLRELRKIITKEHLKSVAIPRLATGVGGLDWSHVQPLVQSHLGDLEVPVYIYTTFHKGVKAEEEAA